MSREHLAERVRQRLAEEDGPVTPARLAAAVRLEGGLASGDELAVLRELQDEVIGAGPLAHLLREDDVTDVLVNAPDEVWVDRGHGLERSDVRFADDAAVRRLVQRLLVPTGRRLDLAQPWVDARLPDGSRLHAVLSPVATRATCVSLRTLRRQSFTLDDLVERGTLDPPMAAVLRAVVAARLAVVVSGGTGTGKTTLLACLLGEVDPRERIVVVEDAAELRPARPHVVGLEARPPNVEGSGEVTLRDLVRQAMRMRPDRLVVGEVRGGEVVDMLGALNTGHEGGLTTVHANTCADVPARLEALAAAAGLPRDALHAQLVAAVDVGVHLRRDRGGRRQVSEVSLVRRAVLGGVEMVPAVVMTVAGTRCSGAGAALRARCELRGADCADWPPG